MNQLVTTGIILTRIDYGEADRILTMLTPDHGKLHLLAKGVRRMKSKLAGGIELFSTSELTYIKGRNDLGTVISTRLMKHYGGITTDLDRTMLGYDLIKKLHKVTEDQPESDYYALLEQAFQVLEGRAVSTMLIRLWFDAGLLRIDGFTPNLQTDSSGKKLEATVSYDFGFEETSFTANPQGSFNADDIKFLRILFAGNQPKLLANVAGSEQRVLKVAPLLQAMLSQHLHV